MLGFSISFEVEDVDWLLADAPTRELPNERQLAINTAMMNQHLESWLLADDPQHGTFSMGLANIELKRGTASQGGPERSEAKSRDPDEAASQVSQWDSSTSLGMTKVITYSFSVLSARFRN